MSERVHRRVMGRQIGKGFVIMVLGQDGLWRWTFPFRPQPNGNLEVIP